MSFASQFVSQLFKSENIYEPSDFETSDINNKINSFMPFIRPEHVKLKKTIADIVRSDSISVCEFQLGD